MLQCDLNGRIHIEANLTPFASPITVLYKEQHMNSRDIHGVCKATLINSCATKARIYEEAIIKGGANEKLDIVVVFILVK